MTGHKHSLTPYDLIGDNEDKRSAEASRTKTEMPETHIAADTVEKSQNVKEWNDFGEGISF
jgi:hypothetical protein